MTIHFVHKGNFPALHECMDIVSHDSGGGCHDRYVVPESYLQNLEEHERAVKELSKEDRETFCIGEQNEMRAITSRSLELGRANEFLEDFFDGFDSLTHQYEADERVKKETVEAKAPQIAELPGKRHVEFHRRTSQVRFCKGPVLVGTADATQVSEEDRNQIITNWKDDEKLPSNVMFRI